MYWVPHSDGSDRDLNRFLSGDIGRKGKWVARPIATFSGVIDMPLLAQRLSGRMWSRGTLSIKSRAKMTGRSTTLREIQLKSSYRLVYEVEDERLVVLVIAIGKRERADVYEAARRR